MKTPGHSPLPEESLSLRWERARTCWPRVHVDRAAYEDWVLLHAKRVGAEWRHLNTDDLYLTCACLEGQRSALHELDRLLKAEVQAVLRKMRNGALAEDEAVQRVSVLLLVPVNGAPPKLHSYSGRGQLRAWLRVVSANSLLNALLREREPLAKDGDLEDLGQMKASTEDPELDYLKQHYRRLFQSALSVAASRLSPRQRNLLRLRFVDGLSLAEVGGVYGAHVSSVKRWLSETRAELVAGIRNELKTSGRIGSSDVSSLLRLVRSQLHLSLAQIPRQTGESP